MSDRGRGSSGGNSGRPIDEESTPLQDILTTLFSLQTRTEQRDEADGDARPMVSLAGMTLADLARIMRSGGSGIVLQPEEEEEEEENDEDYQDVDEDEEDVNFLDTTTRGSSNTPWYLPVTEPQKEGVELLASGDFGSTGLRSRAQRHDLNVARTVLNQRSRAIPVLQREDVHANLVPNTNGTTVATYGANMYTASFSNDSSFYYTCAQDFKLHIFDMRKPPSSGSAASRPLRSIFRNDSLVTRMPVRKVIQAHPGRWTITDANLSPDNERMIYASVTSTVYMTSTAPDGDVAQIPIPFADSHSRRSHNFLDYDENFGIWSCRFSADGNEVVAGGSGKIFVYDLLANRRTVKIQAHNDDVNSCCWADTGSGNVLVSASDDTFLKVWDRRSLGVSNKPSGVLMGHTEGITYVSAKGDGRYIISNGKDQALRLWDLRKMRSSAEHEAVEHLHYGVRNFDYRYPHYPKPRYKAHPKDCSVMTYRGHSVLRTLIRCHFSPAETTGAQYIYSGSSDGRVHIWSLDGQIVQVLDRSKTFPSTFSPSGPEPPPTSGFRPTHYCVRDVSWHTQEPVIMTAGWEEGTVIARHEYKGMSKSIGALEDWTEQTRLESAQAPRRSSRLQEASRRRDHHVPGAFYGEYEDDD